MFEKHSCVKEYICSGLAGECLLVLDVDVVKCHPECEVIRRAFRIRMVNISYRNGVHCVKCVQFMAR